MRRLLAAAALVGLTTLVGCGDDGGNPAVEAETSTDEPSGTTTTIASDDADHTLTIDDNASSLAVAVGDTIEVVLETCPSCGYSWQVMGDDGGGVLTLVSERDGPSDNEEGEVGGTVDHFVRYEAAAPGEATIALGYFPPGEDAPEDTFTVDVTVAS